MKLIYALILLFVLAGTANAQYSVAITGYSAPAYDSSGNTGVIISNSTLKNNGANNVNLYLYYKFTFYDSMGGILEEDKCGGFNPQPPWPLVPNQSCTCGGQDFGGTTGIAWGNTNCPAGWKSCKVSILVYVQGGKFSIASTDCTPVVTNPN